MKESRMADEYERLADKTELSYEEALSLKEAIRKRVGELASDLGRPARWHVATGMSALEAVTFLNALPATRPGEASVTSRPDGSVDIYWFGSF
jgi:hypothetical protein